MSSSRLAKVNATDFVIRCNGLEYGVMKNHLLALSVVVRKNTKDNPSMSSLELPTQYSKIMDRFQQFVLTFKTNIANEDSQLFDTLLRELEIKFDSLKGGKLIGSTGTLQNFVDSASDAGISQEAIIQALLQ